MAPTPQSRFLEGSMNDRASNAPPPDFLGFDAQATAEYERQFALDWQPPDLGLHHHGTRASFMSVSSAVSAATTTRKQNGSSFLAPLWGGVKERLSLNRSKSSNNVHDRDEDSSSHGHFIPPTFKHQRSESINVGRRSRHADDEDPRASSGEGAKLKKFSSAAAVPSGTMPGPAAFDPSGRPTHDEIAANYQNLLASGFFGNRAIQSTRFSAPGQMRDRSSMPSADSFSQRAAENEQQERHQDGYPLPPPDRQPPPPPPNRAAPPPPPPPPPPVASMDTSSSPSSSGIPLSSTVMFPSGSMGHQQASRDMPPPPSPPKQRKPGHKPSLSFSSVPYTSTRPANEASVSRPFRPPPVSLARFSMDSGRRSFDFQLGDSNRGTKRPFTATNDSEMSLDRPSYDIINGDGSGTMITASDYGGHESGARKLVKKLRKSASRISIDLGKTISRPASSNFDVDNSDVNIADSSSAPRQSMSSSIRRSFSWRLGRTAPETKDDKRGDIIRNGDSTDKAADGIDAPPFQSERFIPPSLSVIMDNPESPERNKLKKRDIRGRRLRRHEANKPSSAASLYHQSPTPLLSPPGDGDAVMTMDWRSERSKSRSRSRPRRSELSMMMMQSQSQPSPPPQPQSRPGTAHSTDSSYSFATSSAAASFEPPRRRSAEAGSDSMEGVETAVEFVIPSFHFPNRVRPGNPLTVIPDANRGIPSVPNIPGEFRDVKIVTARESSENGDDDDGDGGGNRRRGNDAEEAQAGAWPRPQQAVF
ncbi:hypothetical protein Daus18300_012928 [Diaporthe australafricana]|uniref:Uncharacterized protein n=1 Tax=Diaporthe australafricana TaxID=127596 RepID=A0ABR3W125_9PEZI